MNHEHTDSPPVSRSRAIPMTFVATAICFVFTFMNVSCQGHRVASVTGLQLAVGTEIRDTDFWGNTKTRKVNPEPLATLALGAAVAGAAFGHLRKTRLTTIIGGVGLFLLLLLKSKLDRDAVSQTGGMAEVTAGFGYVLAVILFFAATILSGLRQLSETRAAISNVHAPAPDKIADAT